MTTTTTSGTSGTTTTSGTSGTTTTSGTSGTSDTSGTTEPTTTSSSAPSTNTVTSKIVLILAILWVVLGFVAFIKSIMCFGSPSSSGDKIIGLLLSVFFGPLYFFYLHFNKKYCRSSANSNANRNRNA